MKKIDDDLPLLGYVDKLSAKPADTLNFKVSSIADKPFTAFLMRSISADPNPAGAGIVEEDASIYFKKRDVASRHQAFYPGSYGIARADVSAPSDSSLTLSALIFPTLKCGRAQSVLSVGDCSLFLDADGAVSIRVGKVTVSTLKPLKLRFWHRIEARIESDRFTLEYCSLESGSAPVTITSKQSLSLTLNGRPCVAARYDNGVASEHFNGKIESPMFLANGQILCAWDFSQNISGTSIPTRVGPALDLVNFPTRAVTGAAWDGSEMNWVHKPEHYAAIHFHEDDIYDFGWETDFSFTIPDDMPSGVYVMRLECGDNWDAIPFFIKPPIGKPRADLCVLVSTFTYAIYGNHARPDFQASWLNKVTEWQAYPHNPAEHPQYGLSTYNYHSDGSGICHASHLRPLFNLRPGYQTFGDTTCSGLRHFQADSHLISWLHNKGIDYDIVTDEDLQVHGSSVISSYKALTTGTHPEYHTRETLDALRDYRDNGGHLLYLGGNGFYWRVALHTENASMLEIRRAEDGIRAWAAEPGEYYNAFDGTYGGLWRRNGRAPQALVGVGFAAQGNFFGDPYKRVCRDSAFDWVFDGIDEDIIGDFGFSGNGAAGFELDHMDERIGTPDTAVLLARSVTRENGFMLVPEEQLTHITNLTGGSESDAKHADMIYAEYSGGGTVFATGSITFCGSLPWNDYDNNISKLLHNVLARYL